MAVSMCIPRVEQNLDLDYVKEKINSLNIGYVKQIRGVTLKNDPDFKRILLRFKWKNNNNLSITLQKQLDELGSLKVVHNMPWYWKIVLAQ
jgi:hypothetical protein